MDFPGTSGITNIGNTCYMNSVLQCISATDILNYYIRSADFKANLAEGVKRLLVNKIKTSKKIIKVDKAILRGKFKDSITYRLYQVFTIMWKCNSIVTPHTFKKSLDLHCSKFKGCNQHDAQEFLIYILDRIHDEIKTDINVIKFNFDDSLIDYVRNKIEIMEQLKEVETEELKQKLEILVATNFDKEVYLNGIDKKTEFLKKNHSIVSELFLGMFMNEIQCSNCSFKSITYEPFNVLQLEICDSNMKLFDSLEQCINNFLKVEDVEYKCDRCSFTGNCKKKLTIFNIPEKLIIHFKRFKYISGRSVKLNNLVQFPKDNVYFHEISDVNKNGVNKLPYELYGVVHHMGGTDGGHYIATTRNPLNGVWYKFDDSNVTEINDDSFIISRSSYILFYQKKRITEFVGKQLANLTTNSSDDFESLM